MPENQNDFNELPKTNVEEQPVKEQPVVENNIPEPTPKIEIPKEYYEKLEQEQHEKAMQEAKELATEQQNKEANQMLSKIIVWTIISGLIVFISLYAAFKIKDIAIFLPIVVSIFLTIYRSVKEKKESTQHTAVLVGGMICAVAAYIVGMVKKDEIDYWMHFAICAAIISFVSYAICAIIHTIIANRENIKALGTIGIILFFVALVGIPYFIYSRNPEEIYKTIFMKTTEVKAETEFEYITKTLKNRYGIDFECQNKKVKTNVQKGRKLTERTCVPATDKDSKVTVQSLLFNEEANQYVVIDNYMDILKFNDYKKTIANNILTATGAMSVNVFFYPEKNCTFLGDCTETDEYFKSYQDETNVDNQYKASSEANYEKYLNMNAQDILNDGKYKVIITLVGAYSEVSDFPGSIKTILNMLNKAGLKNNYGFEITYFSTNDGGVTQKEVYKVKGVATDDQTFKEPKVVD